MIEAHGALDPVWDELYPAEQARILRLLVERIDVASNGISIAVHAAGGAGLESGHAQSIPDLAEQEESRRQLSAGLRP